MTHFLDSQKIPNENLFLPRLFSNHTRDRTFANLARLTTAYLYFCRKRDCINKLAGDDPQNPQILLTGQVEIDPSHLSRQLHRRFEVDTGLTSILWR